MVGSAAGGDMAEIRRGPLADVLEPSPLVALALAFGDAVGAFLHQRPLLAVVRLHGAGVVPVVVPEHLAVEGQTEQVALIVDRLQFLFPKAHAVAYVMMAFRIAWFKVHHPLPFYAAYFYRRSQKGGFDAVLMTHGIDTVVENINAIEKNEDATAKDEDLLTTLEVAYEFYLRGFEFLPISIYESHATKFLVKDGKLLPPFVAISGLGESAAWDLMEGRKGKTFLSVEEVAAACPKVSKTHMQMLKEAGAFGELPDTSQVSFF